MPNWARGFEPLLGAAFDAPRVCVASDSCCRCSRRSRCSCRGGPHGATPPTRRRPRRRSISRASRAEPSQRSVPTSPRIARRPRGAATRRLPRASGQRHGRRGCAGARGGHAHRRRGNHDASRVLTEASTLLSSVPFARVLSPRGRRWQDHRPSLGVPSTAAQALQPHTSAALGQAPHGSPGNARA